MGVCVCGGGDSACWIRHSLKRKPNECVVCGAILHEMDAHQCHTRSMKDRRSKVVQMGSQRVENEPMHHTHLGFYLCYGLNHLLPLNIFKYLLIDVCCGFEKSIPHGQNVYHMIRAKEYTISLCGMPLHPTWHIPNVISCGMSAAMARKSTYIFLIE